MAYYMAEMVHGEKEYSDWFPERSVFCYSRPLRWTVHEPISMICILEKIFKRGKHFGVK